MLWLVNLSLKSVASSCHSIAGIFSLGFLINVNSFGKPLINRNDLFSSSEKLVEFNLLPSKTAFFSLPSLLGLPVVGRV